jgi:spore maturation protein CgeB
MKNYILKYLMNIKEDKMKKVAIIGKDDIDSLAWHIEYTLKEKFKLKSKIFIPEGGIEKKFLNSKLRFNLLKISLAYEEYIFKELIKKILNYEPELVIVILRNIPPFVINELRKSLKSSKIIFWTGDGLVNLERQYLLISEYDAWFVKDTYMYDFMKNKVNLNVYLMPECCNPDFHNRPKNIKYGELYNISIVGSLYPYRAKILEQLIKNNIKIAIFGSMPKWIGKFWRDIHTKKHITLYEKSNVFYGSKINLNTIFYGDINAGNCRLFEIAGAGGFQICDKKDEIKNYFVEGKEIVFFENINELKEKIFYYLNHPDEAKTIADNAYIRAHQEHTYEIRIKEIFKIIGFNVND